MGDGASSVRMVQGRHGAHDTSPTTRSWRSSLTFRAFRGEKQKSDRTRVLLGNPFYMTRRLSPPNQPDAPDSYALDRGETALAVSLHAVFIHPMKMVGVVDDVLHMPAIRFLQAAARVRLARLDSPFRARQIVRKDTQAIGGAEILARAVQGDDEPFCRASRQRRKTLGESGGGAVEAGGDLEGCCVDLGAMGPGWRREDAVGLFRSAGLTAAAETAIAYHWTDAAIRPACCR